MSEKLYSVTIHNLGTHVSAGVRAESAADAVPAVMTRRRCLHSGRIRPNSIEDESGLIEGAPFRTNPVIHSGHCVLSFRTNRVINAAGFVLSLRKEEKRSLKRSSGKEGPVLLWCFGFREEPYSRSMANALNVFQVLSDRKKVRAREDGT